MPAHASLMCECVCVCVSCVGLPPHLRRRQRVRATARTLTSGIVGPACQSIAIAYVAIPSEGRLVLHVVVLLGPAECGTAIESCISVTVCRGAFAIFAGRAGQRLPFHIMSSAKHVVGGRLRTRLDRRLQYRARNRCFRIEQSVSSITPTASGLILVSRPRISAVLLVASKCR